LKQISCWSWMLMFLASFKAYFTNSFCFSVCQRDKKEEALRLAQLSAEKPHFSHCLEWLLFTVFDAEISRYVYFVKRDWIMSCMIIRRSILRIVIWKADITEICNMSICFDLNNQYELCYWLSNLNYFLAGKMQTRTRYQSLNMLATALFWRRLVIWSEISPSILM